MKFSALFSLTITLLSISNAFAWEVSESVDKMTDQKSVIISTESEEVIFASKKAELYVICGSKYYSLHLIDPYLIADGDIEMRIDKGKKFGMGGVASSDLKNLLVYDHEKDGDRKYTSAVNKVRKGKKALFRYRQVPKTFITATFNVEGLDKILKEKCPKFK